MICPLGFTILLILVCIRLCDSQTLPDVAEKAARIAKSDDVTSLHGVAKDWIKGSKKEEGWELMKYLAQNRGYVPSLAKMGHKLAAEGKNKEALEYFEAAAEHGPHHASIFNAGRLMADPATKGAPDWVGALAYFKSGATLFQTDPKFAQESMTKLSKESFEIVSGQAAIADLTLEELADVFIFGSLSDLTQEVDVSWREAVAALVELRQASTLDPALLKKAVTAMRLVWEPNAATLSSLQAYLLLDHMNKLLKTLTGFDGDYIPMAAGYAEALALSPHCWDRFAECFNGAATSSLSYYQKIGEQESVERVLEMAKTHPQAGKASSSFKRDL